MTTFVYIVLALGSAVAFRGFGAVTLSRGSHNRQLRQQMRQFGMTGSLRKTPYEPHPGPDDGSGPGDGRD